MYATHYHKIVGYSIVKLTIRILSTLLVVRMASTVCFTSGDLNYNRNNAVAEEA